MFAVFFQTHAAAIVVLYDHSPARAYTTRLLNPLIGTGATAPDSRRRPWLLACLLVCSAGGDRAVNPSDEPRWAPAPYVFVGGADAALQTPIRLYSTLPRTRWRRTPADDHRERAPVMAWRIAFVYAAGVVARAPGAAVRLSDRCYLQHDAVRGGCGGF